jgi:hypothetical protein
MQFETPTRTTLFLYQNHQDTPSKIQDLYESISMPDSQPHFYSLHHLAPYHTMNDNSIHVDTLTPTPTTQTSSTMRWGRL